MLYERRFNFVCAHCGKDFVVENDVPDVMAKHFQSIKRGLGRRVDWTDATTLSERRKRA